jgi:magnesium transporter
MNVQTVNFQGLYFVNVANPTDFEMKFLRNTYDFDPLNLEDYLHKAQIPKIENHKQYDLIVLRFPVFSEGISENTHHYGPSLLPIIGAQSSRKRRLTSGYVDIFISKEHVVTIHDGTLPQIDRIFKSCQNTLHNRTEYMGKGAAYLTYKIIDALVDDSFPAINEITTTIDGIDKELEDKTSQKTLEDISTTRRNLVVFHTMIKPMLPLLEELRDGKHQNLNDSMRSLWGNALDHLEKIWDRVEDNQELIEGLSRSNESLLAARSNDIVKFLTIITSLAFPFAVVNNLYSMNIVGLPYAQFQGIVWVMFGVMFMGGFSMLLYFKLRKWI